MNVDRDNEQFNNGVTHTVELLARIIGATGWVAGDGSEDYDEDLGQTLLNILAAKGLFDPDTASYAALPAQEWQDISTHGPWDGQPYRQFIRIEGSRDHHGANWARVYCGEAFVRPPDADDGMLGYRREDIVRLCQHGDIDLHTATVTHWMPVSFPPVAVIADERGT